MSATRAPEARRGPSPSSRPRPSSGSTPKTVVAAVSAIALYVRPGHVISDFPATLAVLTICTVGSVATWAGFGVGLRRFLQSPRHARVFNVAMALLLVGSIVPMVT